MAVCRIVKTVKSHSPISLKPYIHPGLNMRPISSESQAVPCITGASEHSAFTLRPKALLGRCRATLVLQSTALHMSN